MARLAIKSSFIARRFEEAFGYHEEGRFNVLYDVVVVDTHDGRQFFLPASEHVENDDGFSVPVQRYIAEEMLDKVDNAGSFDPSRWLEITERGSFEEEEAYDYEMEQRDRRMYGAWAA